MKEKVAQSLMYKSTTPIVIMPTKRPTTLAEKLVELVGRPKWKDVYDNGNCKLKWETEFPFEAACKVKAVLEEYPSYYTIKFNPSHKPTYGKGAGKGHGVITLLVQPELIAYPHVIKQTA